ncbi:Phosphoribosylglycinamide formyltransferase 2 [compost metagenome]
MKKLLILGGGSLSIEIVKAAKEMGIYTVVTDWYSLDQSPAKQIADKAEFISTTDTKALLNLILKDKIDGVLTGYTDSTLPYYWRLCQEANLPCYGTLEQFDFACDKEKFKNKCREFGISVVEEYQLNAPIMDFALNFKKFPILLKPVDNSGARGIHIVSEAMEFEKAYESALSASPSKTVLIERLMNHEEITAFYIVVNSKVYLLGTADRHVRKIQPNTIPLPVGYTFPSKCHSIYSKTTNGKVVRMLESIGLRNGLVFIQSFVDGDDFVFYEMGFRLTGSLEHYIYEAATGINPLKMLINFAVNGEMCEEDNFNAINFNGYGYNLTYLLSPGVISKISGLEHLLNLGKDINCKFLLSYKESDEIPETALGTLQQVGLRVLLYSKSKSQLQMVKEHLQHISFTNEKGEIMGLSNFDF